MQRKWCGCLQFSVLHVDEGKYIVHCNWHDDMRVWEVPCWWQMNTYMYNAGHCNCNILTPSQLMIMWGITWKQSRGSQTLMIMTSRLNSDQPAGLCSGRSPYGYRLGLWTVTQKMILKETGSFSKCDQHCIILWVELTDLMGHIFMKVRQSANAGSNPNTQQLYVYMYFSSCNPLAKLLDAWSKHLSIMYKSVSFTNWLAGH